MLLLINMFSLLGKVIICPIHLKFQNIYLLASIILGRKLQKNYLKDAAKEEQMQTLRVIVAAMLGLFRRATCLLIEYMKDIDRLQFSMSISALYKVEAMYKCQNYRRPFHDFLSHFLQYLKDF